MGRSKSKAKLQAKGPKGVKGIAKLVGSFLKVPKTYRKSGAFRRYKKQVFAPHVRKNMKTEMVIGINPTSAGVSSNACELQFLANTLTTVGPVTNYPLGTINTASLNTPAGLYQLLSTDSVDASNTGIYNRYYVDRAGIRLKILCDTNRTDAGGAQGAVICAILPLPRQAVGDTMSNTTFLEQPLCKKVLLPAFMSNKAITINHSCTTREVYGLHAVSRDNSGYTGDAKNAPLLPWTFVVRFFNAYPSSAANYRYVIEAGVIQMTDFYDRNLLKSQAVSDSLTMVHIEGATGTSQNTLDFGSTGATGTNGIAQEQSGDGKEGSFYDIH